jgi:hypothetical protein
MAGIGKVYDSKSEMTTYRRLSIDITARQKRVFCGTIGQFRAELAGIICLQYPFSCRRFFPFASASEPVGLFGQVLATVECDG